MMRLAAAAALLVAAPAVAETNGLREPSEIGGEGAARSAALFQEMLLVIEHPRCLNCHPVEGGPLQGMEMAAHQPPVVRGDGDFGAPGMRCNTCHGTRNVAYETGEGSIPGHDPWHLAPLSMGWVGLTGAEICEQIKDPERNGGKSLAELHEHNAHDGLVGWGWDPGEGREPVPGTQAIFGALTLAWIETGAACPDD